MKRPLNKSVTGQEHQKRSKMTTRTNRQWRLAARPVGSIKESDFAWGDEAVRELGDGEILVRNKYLSLDPTNRIWMTDLPSYLPPVGIGEVMRGGALGVVEESRNPRFTVGDHVQGLLGWQDYFAGDPKGLQKLPNNPAVPLTAYMGLFGMIGMTAYFGLLDIGQPKEGDTLVVSAANVLLLDEPTNNLDPASRAEVLSAIQRYAGAIVLVTHDGGAVQALQPDRVIVLPDGVEDLWSEDYAELVALA